MHGYYQKNLKKWHKTLNSYMNYISYELESLTGQSYDALIQEIWTNGAMSIPWTQKVELFSQHSICRENYFLCCQSLIFNLLWCPVIKSTMAPFSVVE